MDLRDVLAPEAAQETQWLVRLVAWATPGRIATNGIPWDIGKQRYIINVIIHIDVLYIYTYTYKCRHHVRVYTVTATIVLQMIRKVFGWMTHPSLFSIKIYWF